MADVDDESRGLQQHKMEAKIQRRAAKLKDDRKAKFLATQAALPEHERLDSNRDWDEFISRQLSEGREKAIAAMKQAFLEFLTDEDLPIRLSPDAAALYFCKGGPVVTTRILRMFLEYMAQSRTGLIVKANRVLKHDTVHNYVLMLSTALKRCQNPLERGVVVASHTWIDGYLIPKGMVTTLGKEKHTCYDISTLVRTILSPEYMATMPHTRAPLQLVLFLSLATDCSGRVGEFLATYGKKKKPTFLCWRHTTIVAFRTPAGVTLRGTIRFENLKDGSGDPNKRKIIPLRLLPLELAAEDSFRLLLVLGLIDQVFEGLRCWEDIQRLDPGPNGSKVCIKKSALDLPIFRAVEQHQVTELPLHYYTVHYELGRLSHYMGFEHRLLCGAIRRGAAYLLAMNCTEEERCARMGHKAEDAVYWKYYRNETSTVDFQAIVHQVQAEDMASLSDIALNRRLDIPQKPSHDAYREMWQLPHIAALRETQLLLFDKIITTYKSTKQARAAGAVELVEYDAVVSKYKQMCEASIAVIFAREVAEFFASDCPKVAGPTQVVQPSTMDEEALCINTFEEDNEEGETRTSGDLSASSATITTNRDISDALIDPVLLDETSKNFAEFFGESDLNVPQIGATDSVDHPPDILVKADQYRTGKTVIRPITLVDAVSNALLSSEAAMSDAELAHLMIKSFNNMYPSDHFHPGQEPVPGTRDCRFCGQELPMLISRDASRHAYWCEKKAIAMAITQEIDTHYPQTDKCTWLGWRNQTGQTSKECKKIASDYSSNEQWTRHLHSHTAVRGKNITLQCRFGDCGTSPEIVRFKTFAALNRHTTLQHNVHLTRADSKHGAAETMMWWCPICLKFINQLQEDVDDHARSHMQIINELVRSDGYNGLTINHLAVIPVFCIFCVHDTELSESVRFNSWSSQINLEEHVYQHIFQGCPATLVRCPASIPTDDDNEIEPNCRALPMQPEDLANHLLSAHGIKSRQKKTRNRPTDEDEDSHQPEPPKKHNTFGSRRILRAKSTNVMRQAAREGMPSKD